MEPEYVTRYKIEDGVMTEMKVKREEAFKDVDFILKRDKEFLDIMSKM